MFFVQPGAPEDEKMLRVKVVAHFSGFLPGLSGHVFVLFFAEFSKPQISGVNYLLEPLFRPTSQDGIASLKHSRSYFTLHQQPGFSNDPLSPCLLCIGGDRFC